MKRGHSSGDTLNANFISVVRLSEMPPFTPPLFDVSRQNAERRNA
jgi:hypothetical protein